MNFSPSGKGEKIDEIFSLTVDWMDGRHSFSLDSQCCHTHLWRRSPGFGLGTGDWRSATIPFLSSISGERTQSHPSPS